jgi:hypothetical protein
MAAVTSRRLHDRVEFYRIDKVDGLLPAVTARCWGGVTVNGGLTRVTILCLQYQWLGSKLDTIGKRLDTWMPLKLCHGIPRKLLLIRSSGISLNLLQRLMPADGRDLFGRCAAFRKPPHL